MNLWVFLNWSIRYIKKKTKYKDKFTKNVHHKLVPALFSVLVNTPKYSEYIQETLKVNQMFRRRIFQNSPKIWLLFVFESSLFIKEHY